MSLFLSSVPLGGLNAVNHFQKLCFPSAGAFYMSHTCSYTNILFLKKLSWQSMASEKSYKVELNLTGSSQFVRSGQSCFHDDDEIIMKNTEGFHLRGMWLEWNEYGFISFDRLFAVVSVLRDHAHTERDRKREREGNLETYRKCNYCLSGHIIPGQFHSNFKESTGHK